MRNIIFRLLIHPLFIYAIIAFLECIPYTVNNPKIVLHEMPKVGDNFRVIHTDAVYYYSGKGKYGYPNIDCYYSYGNPAYDVDYKKGGIKTIEKSIADRIPLLGSMCDKTQKVVNDQTQKSLLNRYFSVNYLLFNFSNISHVLFYVLLACCTIFHFRTSKYNYWFGFLGCFLGGAFLEFIQFSFVFGRTASWGDQALNTLGAIVGILLFWILNRLKFIERFQM
jgi:VanZ like family